MTKLDFRPNGRVVVRSSMEKHRKPGTIVSLNKDGFVVRMDVTNERRHGRLDHLPLMFQPAPEAPSVVEASNSA